MHAYTRTSVRSAECIERVSKPSLAPEHLRFMLISMFCLVFTHPVMSDKPVSKRVAGLVPVLHLTIFRLFLIVSLPTIVLLSRSSAVIPNNSSGNLLVTLILAFFAHSTVYGLYWMLSEAAEGNIGLDDGTRLWNLPYQLKGILWLAQHAIFGETKMKSFLTTGADCDISRKLASHGFLARLIRTVVFDGAWMHMTYLAALSYVLFLTISETSNMKWLVASIAYPPFTKIIIDCLYNSVTPIIYCLSPDPNLITRDARLERDEKTGVARPLLPSITPPKAAFWGSFGITGAMWLYFAVAPAWVALS